MTFKIKRIFNLTLVSMILFYGSTVIGFAQAKQFTLEEAINLAVKNNGDAQVARLVVKKSEAAVSEAYGTALPSVNFSAGYTYNVLKPAFFMTNFTNPQSKDLLKIEMGGTNQFAATASLSQIVFNSAVFTAIGTSKIFYNAAKETFKSSITKVVSNTTKAFYGVLLSKEVVKVFETVKANANNNLNTVQALFAEGYIPEYDKIRAEVGVQLIDPELSGAKMRYDNALSFLKMALGIDIRTEIEAVGDISLDENFKMIEDSVNKMIGNLNYDLRSLDLQKKVLKDIVSMRESEYYPTISLFGQYQYSGQSNTWDFASATVKSSAVGVNLSLSLFQGFQSNARVQQAKIDFMSLDVKYSQLEEAMKTQLQVAFNKMTVAREKVKSLSGSVITAKRGYEIAEIRYKEGAGSQVEINDASSSVVQINMNYLQAVYEYIDAVIDIKGILGDVPNKYLTEFDK